MQHLQYESESESESECSIFTAQNNKRDFNRFIQDAGGRARRIVVIALVKCFNNNNLFQGSRYFTYYLKTVGKMPSPSFTLTSNNYSSTHLCMNRGTNHMLSVL